jgi:succinate dehydrogenase hydrophobic anchor subunit
VSSVRLPLLSFLPAIFQVFLGVLTSLLHFGHLAMEFPSEQLQYDEDKKFSIQKTEKSAEMCSTVFLLVVVLSSSFHCRGIHTIRTHEANSAF